MDGMIVNDFIDLSNLGGAFEKAVLMRNIGDILQNCTLAEHTCPDCSNYDQVMSAASYILKWAPQSLFKAVIDTCKCAPDNAPKSLQAVEFLGMGGLMVVAKEVTDRNKDYLIKRWNAYCASAGVTNLLDESKMILLIGIITNAQLDIHQTEAGRSLAKQAINSDLNPEKMKDQVDMVYKYMGMKASVLMRSYINLIPLVIALENVLSQAKDFKIAYDSLQEKEGSNFPYVRILGRGQELNHRSYPDLYFCAMLYYEASGALGTNGRFVRSEVTTMTSKHVLERYATWTAKGSSISGRSSCKRGQVKNSYFSGYKKNNIKRFKML